MIQHCYIFKITSENYYIYTLDVFGYTESRKECLLDKICYRNTCIISLNCKTLKYCYMN